MNPYNNDQLTDAQSMLINSFSAVFPLSPDARAAAKQVFSERNYKRKGLLLQEGDVCKFYTFVVSGCFKMYAVDQNGVEHNLQFAVENEWIADFQSFYDQKASLLYIEAIEPAKVLQIEHDDLLYLYAHFPIFDRNFRIIIERKFIRLQERILQNISYTADERYYNFQQRYPDLIQRLPGTQIASYLGITSEFLSKIKKKISKK
ncbi:Crp/Fnr family transcriptional regulator [Pedobacter mucosus]|uniref:Crp/Fnr family transcriptional regulator n=1 Tax=Pedobacter mucosus TaxID=2895286 RepID=UPI001EE446DA|nr:Crp/Fnr family transcriptional regulator [Pedobacter mucosus]UKT66009.1 Crp/Fnr family transcriptional regulator [Pedobacter mucosus]